MSKKLTTEEFIRKAKEVHSDKYDYSKVKYDGNKAKVCIICPTHGEFWQTPSSHLRGNNCPKCAGGVKYTLEDFICKAKEIHGDKYDYSKVKYVNSNTKVCIVCPKHGEFWQTPSAHLAQKQGCPKCASNIKHTTEEFIERAKETHGDKYDYSKVEYVSSHTKVCIICPTHGEFWQVPIEHLGGSGCPKCANIVKMTTEEFIRKAKEIHGEGKYDYSKTEYVNVKTKVCIICPTHGEFWQTPDSHLQGRGCPKCGSINRALHKKSSTDEFIEKAKLKYGDKYDYSKVEYNGNKTKVCIICPIHGEFYMTPNNHLQGNGCPSCTRPFYMFKENKLKLLKEYDLENMSYHQLMELISTNAIPSEFKKLVYSESGSEKRKDTIKELIELYETKTEEEVDEILDDEVDEEAKKYEEEHTTSEYGIVDTAPTKTKSASVENPTTPMDEEVLPNADEKLVKELLGYDMFSKQLVSYGEKNKFLSQVEIQKIWNNVLSENSESSIKLIDMLCEQRKTSSEWLSYVIDEFFKEYERVNSITEDSEYKFKYAPSLMQKLMVYKMLENDSYLNLCGTGAGKTNAFLMSSRAISAKNSVIICPNSVVDTWEESIKAVYPSSVILKYWSIDDLKYIESCDSAYIIINYDKFSSGSLSTKDKMDEFIETVRPQFICFDELHNAKARDEEASIRNGNLIYFRKHSKEVYGDNFKVLGMTATPLINNLNEVRSLLELITGEEFSEIGNRNTIENIHLAYKNLLLHGFRYVPNYGINVVNTEVKIDGKELKDQLIDLKNSDVNTIEGIFVNDKMESVKNDLTQGTIVYTTFIEKIVPKIEKKLKEFGISYARYTGKETAEERATILKSFGRKEFDVLVASSPITTGVDGLQKFCNKMVMISLPWTNAEYTQLVGRINRQGSVFDEVNIIFPHIDIELDNGKVWSWDNKRKNIIIKKKTLSDAVVDGIFTYTANIDRGKLLKGAIEALRNGEATEDFELNRDEVTATPKIDTTSREYTESVVNETHRRANTATSSTTHKYFSENKSEWRKYHEARDIIRASWAEDPQDVIAAKINESSNHGVIADLGCGRNELKGKIIINYGKWLSFDHVANDDSVIEANTTDLSAYVADESLDVAIYCLSIWGRNKTDYFKEANRMLKRGGIMYVAEPTDKAEQKLFLGDAVSMGFELREFTPKGRFTYFVYTKR